MVSLLPLTLEVSVKFLKEGRNHGFDPSLRRLSIKCLGPTLATSNFERVLGSKIGYACGTYCFKSQISLCKASRTS
jgi:hypothetical protein